MFTEISQRNWIHCLTSPRIERNSRRTSVLQLCTMGKEIIKLLYLAGIISIITIWHGFTWSFLVLSGTVLNSLVKETTQYVKCKQNPLVSVVLNSSECTRHMTKPNPEWLFLSMDATSQVIILIGRLIWLFFFNN